MEYTYKTQNTCSTEIALTLNGDRISNVRFTGGCNGNLKAIPLLVEGMTVAELESKLAGLTCGRRPTSCGDQLVRAAKEALEKSLKQVS